MYVQLKECELNEMGNREKNVLWNSQRFYGTINQTECYFLYMEYNKIRGLQKINMNREYSCRNEKESCSMR